MPVASHILQTQQGIRGLRTAPTRYFRGGSGLKARRHLGRHPNGPMKINLSSDIESNILHWARSRAGGRPATEVSNRGRGDDASHAQPRSRGCGPARRVCEHRVKSSEHLVPAEPAGSESGRIGSTQRLRGGFRDERVGRRGTPVRNTSSVVLSLASRPSGCSSQHVGELLDGRRPAHALRGAVDPAREANGSPRGSERVVSVDEHGR